MAKTLPTDPISYELAVEFHAVHRRSRMLTIYYGWRLARLQWWDKVIGVAVAVGSSATVAALAVWRTDAGRGVFASLVTAGVVLAAVRPVLNLSSHIARLAKVWTTFATSYETLDRLHTELKIHDGRVAAVEAQLIDVMGRASSAVTAEEPSHYQDWLRQAQLQVEAEMPLASLWVPIVDPLISSVADVAAVAA